MDYSSLTEKQKELVRWLVQQVRNGSLPEGFSVYWEVGGSSIFGFRGKDHPEITPGILDVLAAAEILLCTPDYGNPIWGLATEMGRKCILTGKAYEAVDSDIGRSEVIKEETKTGEKLEKRVAQAYRNMGARKVEHDIELAGHQIDVYVELETLDRALHRIAIEVKDYTRPVGIQIIRDFSVIVDRLRRERLIDEGVIVSAAGFSKQARNAVRDERIRLLVPEDLNAVLGQVGVSSRPKPVSVPSTRPRAKLTSEQLPELAQEKSSDRVESLCTLRVFLCHSSDDKPAVRELYQQLCTDGVDPWLDEEELLPGQDWRLEITKAVRSSDVVLACLSHGSVTKAGYVQKEIKFALDVADEQPEGAIFIIPVRLEECDVPERLSRWHWVDLFGERGYERLMRSLQVRAEELGLAISPHERLLRMPETISVPSSSAVTPTTPRRAEGSPKKPKPIDHSRQSIFPMPARECEALSEASKTVKRQLNEGKSARVLLEPAQEELLSTLVTASRRLPHEQRRKFKISRGLGQQTRILHPSLPDSAINVYPGDIEILAGEGLITSAGSSFDITPRGFAQNEQIKPQHSEEIPDRFEKEDHPELGYCIYRYDSFDQGVIGPTPPPEAVAVNGEILVETVSHDTDSNAIAFWLEDGCFGSLRIHTSLRGSNPRRWTISSFSGLWRVKNLTMIEFRVVER